MMNLLKVRFKTNEIVLMSLIISTLFFFFNFSWAKSARALALNDLRAKTEISKKQLAENQALFEKLSTRGPSSKAVDSEYKDQYVLLNERFSSVITGIVNSSEGGSFALTKLSSEDQTTENGYKKTLYSLDAEASFIDIGKFLEKLEDAPLLTEVSSVEINRIDNEMKRCRAHIKLYSYVRIE